MDDADNIVGNEYNTAFGISGSNLRLTDAGGNLDVPLSSLGSDTQDLSIDATGKIISLVDGGSVTINADDADADPNNEIQDLSLSGNTLSLSGDATTVDLSPFVNNDTNELQTLSQSGMDVTLSNGGGTISVADNDNSVTNEVNTAFTVAAGNLNITDSNGTLSVPLSSIDTDTQDLSIDATGKIISLVDGGSVTINAEDADADPNNENQTVSAGTGISVNQVGQDFEITNTAPDQTVTIADGGNGNVTVGGTYPNFTIDVPDATVDTDDQTLSITGDQLSISEGNTVTLPSADGTETIVQSGNANVTVTGDGSAGSPYTISSVDNVDDADADPNNEIQDASEVSFNDTTAGLGATDTQAAIEALAASNAADDDTDATNELQTLSQTGTDVTLSDGGGTISVADNDNSVTNEVNTAFAVSGGNLNVRTATVYFLCH